MFFYVAGIVLLRVEQIIYHFVFLYFYSGVLLQVMKALVDTSVSLVVQSRILQCMVS